MTLLTDSLALLLFLGSAPLRLDAALAEARIPTCDERSIQVPAHPRIGTYADEVQLVVREGLVDPVLVKPEESTLTDRALVLGLAWRAEDGAESAAAFPLGLLSEHAVVNVQVGELSAAVTWCPRAGAAVALDRRHGDRTLTFDAGQGLVQDALLLVDRETDSVWTQLPGSALSGPLQGETLSVLPSLRTSWSDWRARYPETLVLKRASSAALATKTPAPPRGKRELGLGFVSGSKAWFAHLEAISDGVAAPAGAAQGSTRTLRSGLDGRTAWTEDAQGDLTPSVVVDRRAWFRAYPDSLEQLVTATRGKRHVMDVRALANEGFLLRAGDGAVLIDAFLAEPYSIYGALSPTTLGALVDAANPFDAIDVALASHAHRDHFQGEPAQRFLAAQPSCVFATSPQVIDALWATSTDATDNVAEDSVRFMLPGDGEETQLEVDDVRVDFLRLSHGSGRFASMQNLGHVITLGGVTALHVGDAAMVPANFAPYRLNDRGVDVAFVPYWYFDDPAGRRLVDAHLRPALLIACHIPPQELEAVTQRLAKSHPDVVVPQKELESFRVHDRL